MTPTLNPTPPKAPSGPLPDPGSTWRPVAVQLTRGRKWHELAATYESPEGPAVFTGPLTTWCGRRVTDPFHVTDQRRVHHMADALRCSQCWAEQEAVR